MFCCFFNSYVLFQNCHAHTRVSEGTQELWRVKKHILEKASFYLQESAFINEFIWFLALTCGSSSCTKLRLFIAYSLTAVLFSVLVSTLNVFSLSMGLTGPKGMLYLLYVRYLLADWWRELLGDALLEDTSTMLWMLGRWTRFFGLTYVRESNLCLSGIARTSSGTRVGW